MGMSGLFALLAAPCAGSFVGALATRLPRGAPIVWARSACDHCGRPLAAIDLVPLVSWALLGGRCRRCRQPIDRLHPGCEIGAIGLGLWAMLAMPAPLALPTALFGWALLAVAAIDLRHFIIPNALTLPIGLAGLAAPLLWDASAIPAQALGALLGYGVVRVAALAYRRLRGRDGIGEGDARLLAAIGAWVAWPGLPTVLLYAALAGLVHAAILRVAGRDVGAATRLPFGPPLCLGGWLVWLYGPLTAS